jgi:uncharacterized protein (TIGR02145 family)
MAENLKVTHYNNGDEIPTGYSNDDWINLSTGAYAVYGDNESNADTYGYLYNWYAVDDDRGACPESWHTPTDGEWQELVDYLEGYNVAGGKLKECTEGSCPESEYWNSPNTGATNESGFSGLPGGYRYGGNGNDDSMGLGGYFWSSTEFSSSSAWGRVLRYDYSEIYRYYDYHKEGGFSVRCVRDIDYLTIWHSDEPNNEAHRDGDFRDEWLTLSTYTLTIPPYSFEDVEVTFDATNLEIGEYFTDIIISNNDPDEPMVYVPVTLVVDSTSSTMEIEIDYLEGWNLVGLPLDVEDASYSNLFPESIGGTLYSYDGAYVPESYLTYGEGYWLRFNNTGSTTITGTTINELTISLSEGWNLVSGISETVSISSVSDPDGIIVSGTLYGYDGAYLPSEELMAGKGYWLRAYEDGEITLTSGALAKTAPRDFSLKGKANSLTVNGMNLYFGVEMSARERLSYSLPPKPPLGAFDIRFKGDTRIAGENTEIEVMNTYQTLTISYDLVLDAGEHMNWVLSTENGKEYILEGTDEIIVPTEETFTLERKAIIPIAYTLHQNYPNPFNPITSLRYDLPEQAQVTLTVYDLMGREVTQLINTIQEAGYKSVQWNATDTFGKPVSAGVYLYQIRAGEFVQTKKMVLLK